MRSRLCQAEEPRARRPRTASGSRMALRLRSSHPLLGPATAETTDPDATRESLIAAHHETPERDGRRQMMARRRVLGLHAAARTARRRRTCGTWWWSGRGVGVLHGGRERLGAPLHRRWVHPHDLPAVAVEVEEAA